MTISRVDGPLVATGLRGAIGSTTGLVGVAGPAPYISPSNENPDAAPSCFFGATLLRDFRVPTRADGVTLAAGGYANADFGFASNAVLTADLVPATASNVNICASQTTAANTAMTFAAATPPAISYPPPLTVAGFGTIPGGCIQIDARPTYRAFGQSGAIEGWNGDGIGRCINVQVTAGFTGTVTIRGYDCYGLPITQVITNPGTGANNTTKAFKWIQSVTPSVAGQTISVGTIDTFEFPIRADRFVDVLIWWANSLVTVATGFIAPDATNPGTAATGSSRGRYTVQSASNGANALIIRQFIRPINLDTQIGTFGVPMV